MRLPLAKIATLAAALTSLTGAPAPAHAASFLPFSFVSKTSTSGPYDPSRDVRLDSVTVGSTVYGDLQVVSEATIVLDDGVDATRGGGNFAAGRAPNAPADAWAPEGPATVTPTSTDLRDALGNRNLTSLAVTREAIGTAILDVSFATPTNTFFFYERGSATVAGNSDLLVEALNDDGQVIAAYKILRGGYTDTGLVVSTDVGAFSVLNVRLGSIGLHLDVLTSRLRLISTQAANFQDGGPDYKVLATEAPLASVPEPGTLGSVVLGMTGLALLGRRRAERG
jgi:hypothetical protein